MVDFTALTEKVAAVETVAGSVEAIVLEISDELKKLRNEGGGALQNQIDGFTSRLDAVATALGQAAQTGTAAEGETPAPLTSEQTLDLQGQKQTTFNRKGQPLLDQTKDGLKDEKDGGPPKNEEHAEDKTQRGHEEGAQFDADPGSAQKAADSLDNQAKNAPGRG